MQTCEVAFSGKPHDALLVISGSNDCIVFETMQVALDLIKGTRTQLASSHAEIAANMAISQQQRQKQGLAQVDAALVQLQQAALLRDQLKCAPCLHRQFLYLSPR